MNDTDFASPRTGFDPERIIKRDQIARYLPASGGDFIDDEAIRLVKSFPNWVPAKQDCQAIPFKTVVTVPFDVNRAKKN